MTSTIKRPLYKASVSPKRIKPYKIKPIMHIATMKFFELIFE